MYHQVTLWTAQSCSSQWGISESKPTRGGGSTKMATFPLSNPNSNPTHTAWSRVTEAQETLNPSVLFHLQRLTSASKIAVQRHHKQVHLRLLDAGFLLCWLPSGTCPSPLLWFPKGKKKCLVLDVRFSNVDSRYLTFEHLSLNSSVSHHPLKSLPFVAEIAGVHRIHLKWLVSRIFWRPVHKAVSPFLTIFCTIFWQVELG